jgi:hypothetical protein
MWYSQKASQLLGFNIGDDLYCTLFALKSNEDDEKLASLNRDYEFEKVKNA